MQLLPRDAVPSMLLFPEFARAVKNIDVPAMMVVLKDAGYQSSEDCAEYAIFFSEQCLAERGN